MAKALDNGAVALAGSSQLTPAPLAAVRPSVGPAAGSGRTVSDTGNGLGAGTDATPDTPSANSSAEVHDPKAAADPGAAVVPGAEKPAAVVPGAEKPAAVVPGAEKAGAAVVPGASPLLEVKDAADPAAAGGQPSSEPPSVTDPAAAQPVAQGSVLQSVPAAALTTPPAAAQPATASAAPAPVLVHPPLVDQLARPLFTLAAAPSGQHLMTVQVVPDSLGPVTVRAHIGPDGVRIEMLSGTTVGQDGLRALLPDLKRDLAGHGFSPTLTVVPGNASTDGSSGDPSSRQQVPFSGSFRPNGDRGGGWHPRETPEGFGRDLLRPGSGPEEPPGLPDSGNTAGRTSLDITV